MKEYVFYQGSIVAVFAFFSLLVSIIGDRVDLDRFLVFSIWGCIFSATALVVHGLFLPDNAFTLTTIMWVFAAACVVPCTVLYLRAIAVYPDLQASSSALFQSIRMLMLSIGTAVTGSIYNGSYAPIGLITGFCILMAAILIMPLLKEKTNAKDVSRLAQASH
jgi:predicted MFS family arabinose efflux permease